ncbi:MAG: ATP-dependent Clp protease ATP-binding subunit [Clostridia bacterium]|nr:ATP-dependent Clp protease ATP-binding subunit [Clostridia bacterium]
MKLCSRCKQRPAVIYINKIQGEKVTSEGLCIRCAKELNIKPFSDYMEKMGLRDEDMDMIEQQMGQMMEGLEDGGASGAAALDIQSFLGGAMPPVPVEQGDSKESPPPEKEGKKQKKHGKMLDGYCINLTARAARGELDAVIGREAEMDRVVQILCRRQKNNPCLIGEPGVGKTAIAELLAQRIAEKKVPVRLMDKEVFLLDLTALVAGTHFRGQFESRVKSLVEEVKKLGNIILVIDEIHTIVGAGDSEGGMSCANILKPALSRGEIQIIGATTLAEYRKYIEKDQALERRFQPVTVEEPNVQKTVEILKGVKKYYEAYHGLKVPDSILRTAVTLSERYITDRFLPDKAIDILDEACARKVVDSDVINRIDALTKELEEIRSEKEQLEAKSDPDDSTYARIAQIKVSQLRKEEEFQRLSALRDGIEVELEDIARVIEAWTGIPAASISAGEFEKIVSLKDELTARIIGQDHAADAVCRAIKRHRAGIGVKAKPASFIFAGPTGVGKTELVKVLASHLFDTNDSLIRLDMSEFMEKHSVSRIIGSPPGYVGYDDAGQLTEKIRRKPYSVVLFDEIEKAHPDVLNILLQVLDDGKIADAHGKEINFENTVIVMTTNAGSQVRSGVSGFGHSLDEAEDSRTQKGLESFLKPEFINRVDEIITFRKLSREDFVRIAELRLRELKEALENKALSLSYGSDSVALVAEKSYSEKYGARNMARYIQREIEDKISDAIVSDRDRKIIGVRLSVENGEIVTSLIRENV